MSKSSKLFVVADRMKAGRSSPTIASCLLMCNDCHYSRFGVDTPIHAEHHILRERQTIFGKTFLARKRSGSSRIGRQQDGTPYEKL